MKKGHIKDIITSRVFFIVIIIAILAVLTTAVVMILSANRKTTSIKPDTQQKESQKQQLEPVEETTENVVQPQEDTEEIEIQTQSVWTTAAVNFRSGPDTDSGVIEVLPTGTELIRLSEKNGWSKVQYSEKTGYVSADYLTEEKPEEVQPEESQPEEVRPQTTVSGAGQVVVIDPGHQRYGDSTQEPNGPNSSAMKARVTGGTSGWTTGVSEYELTLDISLQLRNELVSRGYTVYMTRESHDVNISNMERAQYASSVGADIAVRIHANGSENTSVSGALALTPSSSNPYIANLASESYRLSKDVLNAYCAATGMNNQGVQANDTMTGINWSTVPVTILEMGYMTNPTDDTNMQNDAYQKKMVQGIADGIDAYFAGN